MMRRKARPNLSTSLGDKVAVETNGGVTTPSSLQQNNYHRQRELEWQFYHGGNSTTGRAGESIRRRVAAVKEGSQRGAVNLLN